MKRIGMMLLGVLLLAQGMAGEKQEFWNTARTGANFYWVRPSVRSLNRLSQEKIDFIYHVYNRDNALCRDILIPDEKLKKVRIFLDEAQKHNLKVVLGVASFRAFSELDSKLGMRVWQNKRFQEQAISSWKRLADKLGDHPALVGYDILPYSVPLTDESTLCDFYRKILSAIRKVDKKTGIILKVKEKTTDIFKQLSDVSDNNLLYSVESRAPFELIESQESPYGYPCNNCEENVQRRQLEAIFIWARQQNIPGNRIFVNYGGYLSQLGDRAHIFIGNGCHWSSSR